jgi:hypothetical protein
MQLAMAGLVVLMVGDSHMAAKDFLLSSLHSSLEEQGASVHSFGVCGSSPHDWVAVKPSVLPCGRGQRHNMEEAEIEKTDKARVWSLDTLLNRYHPNLLVIELGDNMAGYGQVPELPKDWIAQNVREILTPVRADHVPCVWVGPPWGTEGGPSNKTFARVKELSDYLSSRVAPCHYVDSLSFEKPGEWPTYDGEHLTVESYQVWGKDIADQVIKYAATLHRH